MNLQPGDKVRFLNEKGEGVVVKVKSHHIVVLSEGFEFVYLASELVKIQNAETSQHTVRITKKYADVYKKKSSPRLSKYQQTIKKPTTREINLHIEVLLDNYSRLSNSEIIRIQIDRFVRELENAIAHREKKIIFIHGIGEGVLKREIHSVLADYEGIEYYDAPLNRYGFGATEVVIR